MWLRESSLRTGTMYDAVERKETEGNLLHLRLSVMYRVLKNDGKIIIADWVKGAKTWVHERYFSPEELEAIIKQRGFRSIRLDVLNDVMLLIAEKSEPEF